MTQLLPPDQFEARVSRALASLYAGHSGIEIYRAHGSAKSKRLGAWLAHHDGLERRERSWAKALRGYWQDIGEEVQESIRRLDVARSEKDPADSLWSSAELFDGTDAADALYRIVIDLAAGDAMAGAGAAMPSLAFNVNAPAIRTYLEKQTASLVSHITATDRETLRDLVNAAAGGGETVGELAIQMRQHFEWASRVRAPLVARTEVAGLYNFGAVEGMRSAGVARKEWLTARDTFVRQSHADADTQVVPIDGMFRVGTATGPHPGAMSEAGENANCRCVALPVEDFS